MTDKAPERIFASRDTGMYGYSIHCRGHWGESGNPPYFAEYVRSDIVDALIKERDEVIAERDHWLRHYNRFIDMGMGER